MAGNSKKRHENFLQLVSLHTNEIKMEYATVKQKKSFGMRYTE